MRPMSHLPAPKFRIGEVAVLQPPHPSARHLWGQETTVLRIVWSQGGEDAMGWQKGGWNYETDIPAPPPTDLPEDQHLHWIWCEYDLRKKYDPGENLQSIIEWARDMLVDA